MNMSLLPLLFTVGGSLVSIWAALKYIIISSYRIDSDMSARLVEKIRSSATYTWELNQEYVQLPRRPESYEAFVVLGGIPMLFTRVERLMTAGWKGKEIITQIYFPRWKREALDEILQAQDSTSLPISALTVAGKDRLGELIPDPRAQVYLNPGSYEDIEEDVRKIADGEPGKIGFLLHGKPGNGKTQFIKYLAKKYRMPINVVYLNADYDNLDIAKMFSGVERGSIVLLEDFDNYFNGRECLMKNDRVRFTFDSFINALDGIHNDYRGIVFAMTANDLTKVDESIKNRPSRFKYVREFLSPNDEVRARILGDKKLVKKTAGMSLDQVFRHISR